MRNRSATSSVANLQREVLQLQKELFKIGSLRTEAEFEADHPIPQSLAERIAEEDHPVGPQLGCAHFGKPDHAARACPRAGSWSKGPQGRRVRHGGRPWCFCCGQNYPDHLSTNCPLRNPASRAPVDYCGNLLPQTARALAGAGSPGEPVRRVHAPNALLELRTAGHIEECNPDIVQQYHDYFYSYSNTWNLALYIDAFLNEVILRDMKSVSDYLLKVPILQIVGMNSAFISESVYVNSQLNPRISEWMKVSDSCGLVLDDKPMEVMQAMFLFLQGLGFCSSVDVFKLVSGIKEQREGSQRTDDNSAATVEWVDET
uniref:Nanos-type domain-containing protein n=1 Tax=Globodera pallida TaxID=36090 RepID=A0A183CKW9_GLOPA